MALLRTTADVLPIVHLVESIRVLETLVSESVPGPDNTTTSPSSCGVEAIHPRSGSGRGSVLVSRPEPLHDQFRTDEPQGIRCPGTEELPASRKSGIFPLRFDQRGKALRLGCTPG